MKISVWDTYVPREDGQIMHFDILVPQDVIEESRILGYGQEYLDSKPFATMGITSEKCSFCHVEEAGQEVENQINDKGYYILEMDHCEELE